MHVGTLPAKTSKGEDRVETVTNKKLYEKSDDATKVKNGAVFNIPADQFSYPQFDSVEEFVNDCGGAEKAVKMLNWVTEDRAVSSGKGYIRTATTGTEEEIVKKGLKQTAEFSWSKVDSTTSAATVKTTVADIRAKFKAGEMSAADVAAAIEALDI